MINKIAIGVLIAVDIVLCSLCVWAFRVRDNHRSDEKQNESIKVEILENCLWKGLTNNNLALGDDLKVADMEGQTAFLKDIVGDSAKLIVRFSDTNCEECIRFIVVKLLRLSAEQQWDKSKILFLASFKNPRDLGIFKERLHIDFPVYIVEDLQIPAETLNVPYCFATDGSLNIY
ncbi:MAG: hypothetical protein LBR48_08700, partial [Dysgonamonadaceae bacterium]|nr:hypothetical protein [Dysgonamonadaceae bacterium]